MRFRCGFTFFSTWPFSLRHPASKGQSALQKSLVGWPGSPAPQAIPFQVLLESCPSHGLSRTQFYHWRYPGFVPFPLSPAPSGMGSNPRSWQSLNSFSQLRPSSYSAVKHHVRKGTGGQWDGRSSSPLLLHRFSCGGQCLLPSLLPERGRQSGCNRGSPALCVPPRGRGIPLPRKMHRQHLEIPGASVFGTAAWDVKLAQQAKHSILLLKQKKKKILQTCTVVPLMLQDLLITYTFLNYKHVIFLQPLLFTGVIFALFFFF